MRERFSYPIINHDNHALLLSIGSQIYDLDIERVGVSVDSLGLKLRPNKLEEQHVQRAHCVN